MFPHLSRPAQWVCLLDTRPVQRCDPVRRARHINEVGTFRNWRCLMSPEASFGGMIVRDVHGRPPTPWCDASNIVTCTRRAGAADASSTADSERHRQHECLDGPRHGTNVPRPSLGCCNNHLHREMLRITARQARLVPRHKANRFSVHAFRGPSSTFHWRYCLR